MNLKKLVNDTLYINGERLPGIDNPNFKLSGMDKHVHDFEAYIPDEVAEIWDSLSDETKAIAYLITQPIADNEEWD